MMLESEAKGKAKGKAEGKVEGKAESIIICLKSRFGSITKTLEKRIWSMTDATAMDSFLYSALQCSSLKEVSALLK